MKIGIARTLVGAVTKPRSFERRIGDWTASLDFVPTNWVVGLWMDGPPAVQFWLGPIGFGIAKDDPGDDRAWDCAWTLGRVTVGRTELRLDADANIWQVGISFARGLRDFGLYFGPFNVQIEHDIGWHDPRPNPAMRLFVPHDAPRWSVLSRRERAAALGQAMRGQLDLVRFAPADTGVDRPVWIGRGKEIVVLPRRSGDRATIDRDCAAVGLDQDCGCHDADRWLEVNAYTLRKLSAGRIDQQDFLTLSRRLGGSGFVRAHDN